jgi:hypothetical protein
VDTEFVRSIRQRYDALATDCNIGSASGACFLMLAPAPLPIMSVSTRWLCSLPASNSMPDQYGLPPSRLSPCQLFPLTASTSSARQTRPIHECTYTAEPHFIMRRPRGAHDSPLQPSRKLEGPRRIDRARRTPGALYLLTLPRIRVRPRAPADSPRDA